MSHAVDTGGAHLSFVHAVCTRPRERHILTAVLVVGHRYRFTRHLLPAGPSGWASGCGRWPLSPGGNKGLGGGHGGFLQTGISSACGWTLLMGMPEE